MNMFDNNQSQEDKIKSDAKSKYGHYYYYFEQAGKELTWLEENNPAFTKKKKICIVGNGQSLKQKKAGKIIDSFDYVCRMDDFMTPSDKNKDILGSKTTHIVYSANPLLVSWAKGRMFPNVDHKIILLPSDQFTSMQAWLYYFCQKNGYLFDSVPFIKLLLLERLGIEDIEQQQIWKELNSSDLYDTKKDYTMVPQYVCQEIAAKTVGYPSVGISTIFYFKNVLNYDVSVIGLDFEDNNICELVTREDRTPLHEQINYDEEAIVFDGWVENGEVELL